MRISLSHHQKIGYAGAHHQIPLNPCNKIHDARSQLPQPRKLLVIETLVAQYKTPFYDKASSYTSVLTGSHYTEELLSSNNHQRILGVFRNMPLATFLALRDWCITTTSNRRGMSVEEQLAILLKIVGENASNPADTLRWNELVQSESG